MPVTTTTIVMGSTHHFKRTETKDSVAWDLSAATVAFRLKKPDGTLLSYAGTVLDAAAGIVSYIQSDAAVFDTEGTWSRSWLITDGTIIDPTAPITFYVTAAT